MTNKQLPKTYNPADYEDAIYKKWEESGFFNPDKCLAKGIADKAKPAYAISMPPPNRTGILHIGHAVMLVIQDILTRYHRMKGERTLWLPGTDHAAIATQTKVEKILKDQGLDRHKLGREKFLHRVVEFAQESHDTIIEQIKKMGSSCDWSREAYTFDETRNKAVNSVFKMMHDDGLIYRGYRIVNWCPNCQSTLADDEVEYKEERGKLYWLKYGPFVLATSRPETKLGDTAVAVYPGDKRYQDMVGKKYMIPGVLGEFEITVVADKAVDPKFGSGAIKVTPAHDFTDYEIAQKNGIPMKQIINEQGRMMANTGKYAGLTTAEARKAIVADMEKMGLLDHIENNYSHNIAVCYRCGAQIEPLPSQQWFINVNKKIKKYNKTIKELSIEAVKKGVFGRERIRIVPARFEKNYYHWLENLHDWCISRQIWFGHRVPVWYKDNLKIKNQKSKLWELKIYGKDIFDSLVNCTKKIELRAGRQRGEGKYWGDIKAGDVIEFSLADEKTDKIIETAKPVEKIVKKITQFKNLDEVLESYSAEADFPGKTEKDLKKWWQDRKILNDRIKKYGVWAIEFIEDFYVGVEAPKGEGWIQDEDTLDTWFSSGLWTFSTLANSPEQIKIKGGKLIIDSADFKNYHPTSVLETGYDILFFWIARMIIMTTYAIGDIPFHDVYLHGLVRDAQGRKMSKSLGNAIDPLDSIKQYGTDATRLSLVIGTTPGNDMNLSQGKIAGYRNFANKLWNVARYIMQTTDNRQQTTEFSVKNLTLADKWILSNFQNLVKAVTIDLDNYRFSRAAERLRDFTWDNLADWYLEVSKFEKENKNEILSYLLVNLLKLWHPFMPFVTEVIWDECGFKKMLMTESWPEIDKEIRVKDNYFEEIIMIVKDIREYRSMNKIDLSEKLKVIITVAKEKFDLIKSQEKLIKNLRTGSVELKFQKYSHKTDLEKFSVIPISPDIKRMGSINIEKEKTRLEKEIANLEKIIKAAEGRLANKEFTAKAPVTVVEKEKEKLAGWKMKLEKTQEQLKNL